MENFFNVILPMLKEKNTDYCLHVDMDEYLVLKNFTNIKDIINHYSPHSYILHAYVIIIMNLLIL